MILFDIKEFYIIYRICKTKQGDFVTSEQLASELGLTSRTIKTMINGIFLYANKNGFKINSKAGYGYYIEVINPVIFQKFQYQLYNFFNKYNANLCEHNIRVLYIILYLLQLNHPITIEKLKTMFFVSYSTIYNDIIKTKKILRHGLSIETIHGKSIQIIGNEIEKRNQVILIYNDLLFSDGIKELFDSPYYAALNVTEEEYAVFAQTIQDYNISVSNEAFTLLLYNLKLANQRYMFYNHIHLTFQYEDLKQLSEYQCAFTLFRKLSYKIEESEEEIALFAAYLLIYNNKHADYYKRYGNYYNQLTDFIKDIRYNLDLRFPQIFSEIADFEILTFPIFTKLYFALQFNLESLAFDNLNYRSEMTMNQVYSELARSISEIISFRYQKKISVSLIQIISFSFAAIFDALPKSILPLNILVIPKENENYWPYLMNKIQTTVSAKPNIDFIYEYQINTIDIHKYDLILSDYDSLYIQSETPIVKFNVHSTMDIEFITAYSEILNKKSHNFADFVKKFDKIYIHNHFIFQGISDLLMHLQNEVTDNLTICASYIKDKNHIFNYYSSNGIVIIPNIYNNAESKNIISIYNIKKRSNQPLWRERVVSQIVFINFDLEKQLSNMVALIEFVNYILSTDNWINLLNIDADL
ncbi:hypothetical protein [Dielma fastidiosa]|uniref:hypothetical protein n=1 Tax=Dielma fastidiosa TaxID=1034346 RepID=UPI0035631640